MTKAKRTLALLTAMLTAAALVSCGGNKTGSSTPAGTSDPATSTGSTDSGKVVPIKWLTTGDTAAEVIESGDRIVAAINEKLGIDLSVTYVPEGNTEKVNVAMASGDFPDIVTGAYGTSATQGWIDNGRSSLSTIIWPICPISTSGSVKNTAGRLRMDSSTAFLSSPSTAAPTL